MTHLMHATARLLCQPSANLAEMATLIKRRAAARRIAQGDRATAALDAALSSRFSFVAAVRLGCSETMYVDSSGMIYSKWWLAAPATDACAFSVTFLLCSSAAISILLLWPKM